MNLRSRTSKVSEHGSLIRLAASVHADLRPPRCSRGRRRSRVQSLACTACLPRHLRPLSGFHGPSTAESQPHRCAEKRSDPRRRPKRREEGRRQRKTAATVTPRHNTQETTERERGARTQETPQERDGGACRRFSKIRGTKQITSHRTTLIARPMTYPSDCSFARSYLFSSRPRFRGNGASPWPSLDCRTRCTRLLSLGTCCALRCCAVRCWNHPECVCLAECAGSL